jgi:hypothetical protein
VLDQHGYDCRCGHVLRCWSGPRECSQVNDADVTVYPDREVLLQHLVAITDAAEELAHCTEPITHCNSHQRRVVGIEPVMV